jgi:hypothetical protein
VEGEIASSEKRGWLMIWAVGESDPTVEEVVLLEVVEAPFPCAMSGRTSSVIIAGGTNAAVAARRMRKARRVSAS